LIKPIRFVSLHPSEFYETLKTRVNQHFKDKDISRYANSAMMLKTALLLTGYLGGFALLLIAHPALHIALFLWAFMGFCLAGIGMSIMHDANHGAYSKNKQVNYWLGHTLNLLGGSVFNWKLQHNYLHHTFTNIANWDEDIQNKLALRLNPDGAAMPFHRFQYIYAFLLYSIATLYWVIAKDFFQFIRYAKKGINKHNSTENRILFLKMTLAKLVYFVAMLVLPPLLLNIAFWPWLLGFLIMHFFAGIILTVIFQLAHTIAETSHPIPTENGTIENAWAIHQMQTTANFSRDNKWLSWYVGGLNFQVEHHLFPTICHVHYPELAPIVKQTAEEFGIPYLENKTFFSAIASHIQALKRFGLPNINEAIN
jgi:linoleoyl-CoA desaturase